MGTSTDRDALIFSLLKTVRDLDSLDITDEEIRDGHRRIEHYEWIARAAWRLAREEQEREMAETRAKNVVPGGQRQALVNLCRNAETTGRLIHHGQIRDLLAIDDEMVADRRSDIEEDLFEMGAGMRTGWDEVSQ